MRGQTGGGRDAGQESVTEVGGGSRGVSKPGLPAPAEHRGHSECPTCGGSSDVVTCKDCSPRRGQSVARREVVVVVDLTGSNFPEASRVECVCEWAADRDPLELRRLAAEHYAVPLDQVGPVEAL